MGIGFTEKHVERKIGFRPLFLCFFPYFGALFALGGPGDLFVLLSRVSCLAWLSKRLLIAKTKWVPVMLYQH
jgi:hypothetical protein